MTVVIDYPAGQCGRPAAPASAGPAFGYMLEGEMLFELEGEPPRVIRAGETFWEPGGDVIHYPDGNNRDDMKSVSRSRCSAFRASPCWLSLTKRNWPRARTAAYRLPPKPPPK